MAQSKQPQHSKYFSPSSIARRIACPMSAFLEAKAPEEGPKPAADWGTYCHYISEKILRGEEKDLRLFLGKKKFGQVCDKEMIECAEDYLADVARVAMEREFAVESKVNLSGFGMPEVYGTADLIVDELFGELLVLDLKSGAGVKVFPKDNAQLMTYALCAAGTPEALSSYTKVTICISQPRAPSGGSSLKKWTTTPKDLGDWLECVLRPCYDSILSGSEETAKANPSHDACMWCKGKTACEAYVAKNLALTQMDFMGAAAPAPVTITPELVSRVYPHLKLLKDFVKSVENEAMKMVKGKSLPGYKLVKGRKSRMWTVEEEAVKILTQYNISPYEKKILTPAKAEKAVKGIKGAREQLNDIVAVMDGKPTIAHESDKRKEI